MASADVAPDLFPDSFLSTPETIDDDYARQLRIVAELGAIVADQALTPDEQDVAIAALRTVSGCGTLEFRMLHMLARHDQQLAAQAD